jgi:hypothetical protein
VVWDDGEEEVLTDIPTYAAVAVDEFLDTLEDAEASMEPIDVDDDE